MKTKITYIPQDESIVYQKDMRGSYERISDWPHGYVEVARVPSLDLEEVYLCTRGIGADFEFPIDVGLGLDRRSMSAGDIVVMCYHDVFHCDRLGWTCLSSSRPWV